MMKIMGSILLILLIGCTPVKPDYYKSEVLVKWEESTRLQIIEKCGAWKKACAIFSEKSNICTIYSPTPKYVNDTTSCTLGHETLHCFRGYYHGKSCMNRSKDSRKAEVMRRFREMVRTRDYNKGRR